MVRKAALLCLMLLLSACATKNPTVPQPPMPPSLPTAKSAMLGTSEIVMPPDVIEFPIYFERSTNGGLSWEYYKAGSLRVTAEDKAAIFRVKATP